MMKTSVAVILSLGVSTAFAFDFRSGVPEGMTLRGESRLVADPEHGQVMQVGWGAPSQPEGLWLRNAKAWSPPEGFRVKVVFKLNPKPKDQRSIVLVDNKGLYLPPPKRKDRHCGWALLLPRDPGDTHVPTGYFGHGDFSQSAKGTALKLNDGRWHEIEMFFSGAGEVTFMVDGKLNAQCPITPGMIAPAKMATVFGDRAVGNHNASGAWFAAAEIVPVATPPLSVSVYGRTAFERLEANARLHLYLHNNLKQPLNGLKLNGQEIREIPAQGTLPAEIPVDTVVRSGAYKVPIKVSGTRELTAEADIFIAPTFTAAIPVLMRRGPVNDLLPYYGFTHQMIHVTDTLGAGPTPQTLESLNRQIDDGVRHGLRWVDLISIAHTLERRGQFLRVDRGGKPYPRASLETSNPEVQMLLEKHAANGAAEIQRNPFVDITVVNNEVRGGSMPSFGKFEPENYRKFSGSDIPAEVRGGAVSYAGIPGFPRSRVVPDDYYLLKYYRWFFKDGDGWNVVQRRMNRAYKQTVTRSNFRTIHDPITRVPPLWGSGGDVDGMSQWVYTNPDPVKVSMVLDELEAMGHAFNVPREIYLCIQSIWYRSHSAPIQTKVKDPPQWLSREPEAKFITVAPDHLQEAIWLAVAHRLDCLATHGYGSLIEEQMHSYRYTNTESREVFKRMIERVVRPLGPLIKAVPERRPDMVILESFASQILAGHGTGGWGTGWIADLHLALQWAHYQPGVIYEEELLRDKLAGVKVLVMPGCEVLSQSVYDEIKRFQRRGGIVIGDEYLVPCIIPDISVNSVARNATDAAGSKVALQKIGAAIRAELDEVYQSGLSADNPDIVVRRRSCDGADYLFVINDKRTYGDYVGQWRMVMEKGLPNQARVTVDRDCSAAYDLIAHREIPYKCAGGKTSFNLKFATNDGALILLLEKPIAAIIAEAPQEVAPGQQFKAVITLLDTNAKPARALLPVRATLTSAAGDKLDGSGYFCAKEGRLEIHFTPSRNDPPGELTLKAQCLASGRTVEKKLQLIRK